jgi:hypothetical protein
VRRPVTALIAVGVSLGVGATALAQGGDDRLSVDLQDGCLNSSRVTVVIDPPDDGVVSPLSVSANGREVLHLNGLTGEARMTVRLASARGQVTVTGKLVGGDSFSRSRDYRPCAPRPEPEPQATPQRNTRPDPTLTGGGEG